MSKKRKQESEAETSLELTIDDFPYKIKLQHDPSGVVIAAGTDDIENFTKTDLMKMVKEFKKRITASTEEVWPDENASN